jgi:hypothetical protein
MSHRNIELQVGISKVNEITRIQQQMQQQQMNQQGDFEQAIKAQMDKEVSRPNSPHKNSTVSDREKNNRNPQQSKKKKRNMPDNGPEETEHPFKGKNIDLRG